MPDRRIIRVNKDGFRVSPNVPFAVDWSNPLTVGLRFLCFPGDPSGINLARPLAASVNSLPRGSGIAGRVGTGNGSGYLKFDSDFGLHGGPDVSLLARARYVGSAWTESWLIWCGTAWNSSYTLMTYTEGSDSYTTIKIAHTEGGSGTVEHNVTSTQGREWHTYGGVIVSGVTNASKSYYDGVERNSGTITLGSTGSSPTINVGSMRNGYNLLPSGAEIEYAAIWARVLSAAEFAELHRDFYQIVRPPRRLFGVAAAAGDQTITLSGIASAEAFGTPRLDLEVALSGISSAEAFGTPRLDLELQPTGIASAEAFGSPRLDLEVTSTSIGSAEAFGSLRLDLEISVAGIGSAEAFGDTTLGQDGSIVLSGIPSSEAFGAARLDLEIAVTGIASAEAFGSHEVSLGDLESISGVGGIGSAEAFGSPRLDLRVALSGIASAEAFGATTVSGGASTFASTRKVYRAKGGRAYRSTRKDRTVK